MSEVELAEIAVDLFEATQENISEQATLIELLMMGIEEE